VGVACRRSDALGGYALKKERLVCAFDAALPGRAAASVANRKISE
jgi:hypothetical protein